MRTTAIRIVLLLAAGLVVYANSLTNPLVIDDHVTILENEQIRSLWSLDVLRPARELPVAGRPLSNVSFAVGYAVHGTQVAGYRIVNLALHMACGLAAFLVLARVLGLPGVPAHVRARATETAFGATLLWLLHPLNSEVVNYLTQRTESLMALCLLIVLYASVRALEAGARRWSMAAVVACALGMMSKETMVVAPVVVALLDRTLVFSSWREGWQRRRGLYLGLAATWGILAVELATGPRLRSAGFDAGVSVWSYLLNQTVMITRYLRLTLWPDALVVY